MNLKKILFLFLSSVSLVISQDIIKGINWFGFETQYNNLQCTWTHDINWHLDKIKNLGFSHIRLPFSLDFIKRNEWKDMDNFFELTKEKNLKVVLDFHRLYNNRQSFKPYEQKSGYQFEDFLEGWKTIAERYKRYDNLVALDIFNEYQGPDYNEWNRIVKDSLLYLEREFPNRFEYYVGGTNWGGNIHNMDQYELPFSDRITYTIHKYHFSDTEPYENKWDFSFGDHNKVNIGEWGFISTLKDESEWADKFVDYLIKKNKRDSFIWTYSFNSGDTGGILLEDCNTVDNKKMKLLYKLWNENRELNVIEYYQMLRGSKKNNN
jgi:endoglucanase